uniref:Uncharacterized protein n=1 Tax=Plectus sambesii TaxID=2011161 RepID=A0A914WQP9_9BILA
MEAMDSLRFCLELVRGLDAAPKSSWVMLDLLGPESFRLPVGGSGIFFLQTMVLQKNVAVAWLTFGFPTERMVAITERRHAASSRSYTKLPQTINLLRANRKESSAAITVRAAM